MDPDAHAYVELGTPKVWRRGSYIVAFAGDIDYATEFRLGWDPPDVPRRVTQYYVDRLSESVRPFAGVGDNGADYLIACPGLLVISENGRSTYKVRGSFAAIGTGALAAEGAARALLARGVNPASVVKTAVRIAGRCVASCGGKVDVECT